MKALPGLNIQYPISRLIAEGKKTVETRTYPLPAQYLNKLILIVETPGRTGAFKARIIGTIRFGACKKYASKEKFLADIKRHCVDEQSPWAWSSKPKWAWIIDDVAIFKKPLPAPTNRGIVFTRNIQFKMD